MSEVHAATWTERLAEPPLTRRSVHRGHPMLRAYSLLIYAVGLILLARAPQLPMQTALAVVSICVAALAPAYFWCAGHVAGLPVFPVFALTFTWTYALPLLNEQRQTLAYSPEDHLAAGMAVAGFLVLAMLAWLPLAYRRTRSTRRVLLVLSSGRAIPWLVAALGIDAAIWMTTQAGWLRLDGDVAHTVQAVLLGVTTVATFLLAYLWSAGRLRGGVLAVTCALFVMDALANMTGLLLINVLSKGALAVLGVVLGGRRVRIAPIVFLLAILVPLHYGKYEMREQYWGQRTGHDAVRVTPWDYPRFFGEWYQHSAEALMHADESRNNSFTTRASLIQLFLLARDRQEHGTAPLVGATYSIIPRLLVPRVLMPDKPASHEGTYLLNIRYGLQRREDTRTTTIGWGLFNEAYGNFGYAGLAGLALVLGAVLGAYARWTDAVPELSARFLCSILVLALAFETEFSASVLVTALFQSVVGLGVLVLLLGGRRTVVR